MPYARFAQCPDGASLQDEIKLPANADAKKKMQSPLFRFRYPPSHAYAFTGTTLPVYINLQGTVQRGIVRLFRTVGVHLVGVDLGGELLVALGGSLDGLVSGVPVGGADLAVLVGELEGVDQAEGLVDAAADGEVVDGDLADDAVGVDDEEAAESDALLLNEHTVVLGELVVLVGEEGDVDLAEAAVPSRCVGPCQKTWFAISMIHVACSNARAGAQASCFGLPGPPPTPAQSLPSNRLAPAVVPSFTYCIPNRWMRRRPWCCGTRSRQRAR